MRVASGRDFQALVMGSTAATGTGASAPANYIAISANNVAPADGDVALTGEINAAGGGLNRKQAVYGHTAGASNYTLTATFTANASDALPVIIAKMAVLNAAAAGTMVFETLVTPAVTLNNPGDALTITETVSL